MSIRVMLSALATLMLGVLATPASAVELKGWLRETPDYPQYQGLSAFFDRLKTTTQGRYTGKIACCDELGQQKEVFPKFKSGEVDIALFYASALDDDVPEIGVFALPFIFRNPDQMMTALNGEVGHKMSSLLEKKGYVVLAWFDGGARSFYSRNKLLPNASDFKNQTVRVANKKDMIAMVKALGAKPSTLSYGKVADALKSGEIDVAENDFTSYYTSEHYKVAPYFTFSYHLVQPIAMLISAQRWKTLSDADKNLFRQAAAEAGTVAAKTRAQKDAEIRAKLEKAGVKFSEFHGATTAISAMNATYKPAIVSDDATDIMVKIMTTPTH